MRIRIHTVSFNVFREIGFLSETPTFPIAINYPDHFFGQAGMHVVEVPIVLHGMRVVDLLKFGALIACIRHLPAWRHSGQWNLIASQSISEQFRIEYIAGSSIAADRQELCVVERTGEASVWEELSAGSRYERIFLQWSGLPTIVRRIVDIDDAAS